MPNKTAPTEKTPEPPYSPAVEMPHEHPAESTKPSWKKALLIALLVIALVVVVAAGGGYWWWQSSHQKSAPSSAGQSSTANQPDSASTLASPQKIMAADGVHYFYYGAPAGQNNAKPKKIIISLPGHGTTAEDDYNNAWLSHIKDGSWALASVGWWDGGGEQKQDYMSPAEVVTQAKAFLTQRGYTAADTIVLEGFSRGSANTYAVIANDRISSNPIFDAAISASGGYQSDFPLTDSGTNNSQISNTIFDGVYWVLVCGGKDDNPNRDGCPAMQNTQAFLDSHGATVLGLLEDPNLGHGAFHMSSMNLPEQALQLIENKFK